MTEYSSSSSSTSGHNLDFQTILESAKNHITQPRKLVEVVKDLLSDPRGYFASRKDGSINDSIGFYLVVVALYLICRLLGHLFSINYIGFLFAFPAAIAWSFVGLAIGSAIIFVAGNLVAKGEGTFWESTQIACRLSWVFIIPAFPLWVFLPGLVQALFSIAAYLLWAYLAVPATTARFKNSNGNQRILIWALAGSFSLFLFVAALTGTAVKKGIDYTNDYYTTEMERLQKEAVQNSQEMLKVVEEQQKKLIEEMKNQQARQEAGEEAAAAEAAKKPANK